MNFKNIQYQIQNRISPIKTLDDPHLMWIGFANAGMLNAGNTYCINHVVKNLPTDDPVVEIGSFSGLSTNVIIYFLRKYNRSNKLFSCDKWIFEEASDQLDIGDGITIHKDYRQFVKENFKRNVSFFSKDSLPYTIEAFSNEFFKFWKTGTLVTDVFGRNVKLGGPICFAYIDGDHSYKSTKEDFENVDASLVQGGFIMFDDTSTRSQFGCGEFMKVMKKDSRYKTIMRNPNYLFQKVKP